MKRIYLLFAMLLGLFGLTNMSAQSAYMPDEDNPLILDVSQFSSPMDDSGEGNFYALLGLTAPEGTKGANNDFWHSNWHNGDQPQGTHYFQVEMLDPESLPESILFVFTRRPADNDHTTQWSVRGTNDPDAEKDACEELAFIETPFSSNSETLTSDPFNPKGYQYLRFYSEATVNVNNVANNRGYFHLARFQLYPALVKPIFDQAIELMNAAYDRLSVEEFKYPTGTGPGMYDQAALDAFVEALTALTEEDAIMAAEDPLALAEQIIAEAEAKLQALKETRNLDYSLPTGYYFIKGAMQYTNTDEDGNSFVIDKYLMGHEQVIDGQDCKLWAAWFDFNQFQEDENDIIEGKARALWRIENKGDGTYAFESAYKDAHFTQIDKSANAKMTNTADTTLMALDPVYTDDYDGTTWVNIRSAKQNANDYFYVHQGGHNNGTGVNGFIVGWSSTFNPQEIKPGASEWIFEPVDEAEAQKIIEDWAPLKDRDSMIRNIRQMIKQGKDSLEVAKDIQTIIEEDKPVVSDENWITSPCSDRDEGQHIEYLWDGKGDTFWHSDWHGAFVAEDHHFFQVEIPEDLTSAVFKFTRRNTTSGNQINKWTVWGSNTSWEDDESIVQGSDGLEKLADITTAYQKGVYGTQLSTPFETKGYKYLRFYVAGTCNDDGSQGGNEKFMHLAEFQLYPGELFQSETCQYTVMGSLATKLEEVIARLDEVENEALTADDYSELKAAYDAFMGKFVDPARLRAAMASHEGATKEVVVGTNPGFWPANSSAGKLDATLAEAKAYDEAGNYDEAQSEKYIADMATLHANIPEEANKVQEGKWYRIRYGTEAEYEQYGWPTDGNETEYFKTDVYGETEDNIINESLFGKYLVPADFDEVVVGTNDDGTDRMGYRTVQKVKEEIYLENYVFADNDEDIEDKDLSLWRFINVGDTAYVIQNKATGLFMRKDGNMRLSISPTLFTQYISGYGQNSFIEKSLEKGAEGSPMHLARNYNILTTWGSKDGNGVWAGTGTRDGRRGCFFVEEAEDVASDYSFGDYTMSLTPGDTYGRCWPVPITVKDPTQGKLWTVNSIERTAAEGETPENVKVNLAEITDPNIPAGRPFLYVVDGDMPEPDTEYDPALCEFSFTFDLINTPQTDKCLKGAFDSKTMEGRWIGVGTGHEEKALQFNNGGSTGVNRIYILDAAEDAEPFSRTATLEFTFDESAEDGIATAIKNVTTTGNIYSLDGRLIGRGNLNSLRQKGVYIINGVKVTVK